MEMVEARQVDWAIAEAMAFGSLLKEGIHVREAVARIYLYSASVDRESLVRENFNSDEKYI
jgi:hypothetical protein